MSNFEKKKKKPKENQTKEKLSPLNEWTFTYKGKFKKVLEEYFQIMRKNYHKEHMLNKPKEY